MDPAPPAKSNASESSASSRDRILQAALRLFHRDAFQAVGINSICLEAGVVKGSFYHFFPSKSALLLAVLEELSARQKLAFEAALASARTGRDRILAWFSSWLDQMEVQKDQQGRILGCTIGVIASELSGSGHEALPQLQSGLAEIQSQFRRLVRQGIEDGSIAPSVEPVGTAYALLALHQGLSTLGRASNKPELLRETAQLSIRRLLPVPYS